MNKLLVNILCIFILNKKKRNNFRKNILQKNEKKFTTIMNSIKNLENKIDKIEKTDDAFSLDLITRQNNFFHRLQLLKESGVEIPDIDYANSIIFNIISGLTDQVSFFLFVLSIKDKINSNVKIYFNLLEDKSYRKYSNFILENFNIKEFFSNYQIVRFPKEVLEIYSHSGLYNFSYEEYYTKFFSEETNLYSYSPPFFYQVNKGIRSLDIKDLRKMLQLITPLNEANKQKLQEIKAVKNSVCIHLRMGDTIEPRYNNRKYLPCVNYFLNSIQLMQKKLNNDNIKFFLFSDSIKLAKLRLSKEKILKNIDIDFVNVNTINEPFFEIELMKNCQHFIISGGNFSDLVSTLCENENKIIISPDKSENSNDFSGDNEKEWHFNHKKWVFYDDIGNEIDMGDINKL